MKWTQCTESVPYPELFTFLRCSLMEGHLSGHRADRRKWEDEAQNQLRKYRLALERIAGDEIEHDCRCDPIHDVTRPCVQIAQEALA